MIKALTIIGGILLSCVASADSEMPPLTAQAGKTVKLSLNANPTTGYSWMIDSLPQNLIFVSNEYHQSADCPKDAVGCHGEEVFYFIARNPGESTLKLIYGRPFDKSDWQEKAVKVVID